MTPTREDVERVAQGLSDLSCDCDPAHEAAAMLRALLARAEEAERRLTACGRLNNRHVDKWEAACDREEALRARLTALADEMRETRRNPALNPVSPESDDGFNAATETWEAELRGAMNERLDAVEAPRDDAMQSNAVLRSRGCPACQEASAVIRRAGAKWGVGETVEMVERARLSPHAPDCPNVEASHE